MPASASGATSDASTPTSENANGPCVCIALQVMSPRKFSGTILVSATTESSSLVRVIEKSFPLVAQAGTGASAGNLQITNDFDNTESASLRAVAGIGAIAGSSQCRRQS